MNFNNKLAVKYPRTPVEKEVVNWRVQVFANSTVNFFIVNIWRFSSALGAKMRKNGIAFVMSTFSLNNDAYMVKKL